MTAENFDALLTTFLNRRPFQIFTVELHGGKRFEIDHPLATVVRTLRANLDDPDVRQPALKRRAGFANRCPTGGLFACDTEAASLE
jgi:hypothetical protein